jgi:hypothetical protein
MIELTAGIEPPARELESNDPVVFGVCGGSINRGAEAAVLADKIVFRDPTGTAAEGSNRNANLLRDQKVHQPLQGWHADAVDLFRNAVLDQGSRLPHEHDARLVPRIERPFGHQKREGSPRRIICPVGCYVKQPCHVLSSLYRLSLPYERRRMKHLNDLSSH